MIEKIKKKIVKYIKVLITLTIIYYSAPWIWAKWNYYDKFCRNKFTSEAWFKTSSKKHSGLANRGPDIAAKIEDQYAKERCSMYDDLIKNHLKTGMTLKEVEAMIGKTPMVGYCKGDQVKCLQYSLGSCLDEDILGTLLGALSYHYYAERFFSVCFDRKEQLTEIVPVHDITCGGDEDNEVGCYIDGEVRCYGKRKNGSNGLVDYTPW